MWCSRLIIDCTSLWLVLSYLELHLGWLGLLWCLLSLKFLDWRIMEQITCCTSNHDEIWKTVRNKNSNCWQFSYHFSLLSWIQWLYSGDWNTRLVEIPGRNSLWCSSWRISSWPVYIYRRRLFPWNSLDSDWPYSDWCWHRRDPRIFLVLGLSTSTNMRECKAWYRCVHPAIPIDSFLCERKVYIVLSMRMMHVKCHNIDFITSRTPPRADAHCCVVLLIPYNYRNLPSWEKNQSTNFS